MKRALIALALAGCAHAPDDWQAGCPVGGDCEDFAMCHIEKMRAAGDYKWKLYRVMWEGNPFIAHMYAGNGNVFVDQKGTHKKLPDNARLTHTCWQMGEHGVSARGEWMCVPVQVGQGPVFIEKAL